jgi:hypothetical protein
MMRCVLFPAAGILLALSCLATLSVGAPLSTAATCDGSQVVVSWSWTEDPGNPTGDPEWTGYDVWRRGMATCGDSVRVNDTPFPRTLGASESFSLTDLPPAGQAYVYTVVLVRADRTPAPYPENYSWDVASSQRGYAACPETTVPITQGRVSDEWGWTLLVEPCDGSCYPRLYVMDYEGLLALWPYVGSEVRIYGSLSCDGMDGCYLSWVDHFEGAACAGPVPAGRTSWGRVKSLYR